MERYNFGADVCDKWASTSRLAPICDDHDGKVETYTFTHLKKLSDRLTNSLLAQGVGRGDRVGIILPQCRETAIVQLAIYKIGAVAISLFKLFCREALQKSQLWALPEWLQLSTNNCR